MKKYLMLILTILVIGVSGCASNKDSAIISSTDDLAGKKIGVQIGTIGDIYASEYEGDANGTIVERYSKANDAISSLKNNKIDCVVIDEEPAKEFVTRNNDLTILEEEFALEEYAICISKDNTELKEKINVALEQIKEEGILDNIVDYYINNENSNIEKYESLDNLDYANGELIMATNVAFQPYEYYENNEAVGIDVDMAKAVADRLNMKLVIEDMEFDAIITAVQGGKADIGVAGLTVTEEVLV